ncbi:MAG: ring,2-phenylacetyl-CoA epoxidase subunit PaaC [Pseudonocardiales bacterium]|jgi:ring-1,2-phenylacetyl-CoA epoxidase subunit PaaC|nr:ring,2-phenylacetyl-CoA epoxidase subunit PaaC [Pseudonocardiales bacterium]
MTSPVSEQPGAAPANADVAAYAIRLGDDALILSHRLSEWTAHAPQIEEDLALANIALDLLGQARTLLAYGGAFSGRSEDDLAYLREERQFTNLQLTEIENGDFAVTMIRQLLFSCYQHELYRDLESSTDAQLAAIAAKAVKEVSYHVEHASTWVLRLGDGTELSHDRTQAALDAVWPYSHELFVDDELVRRMADSGVGPLPSVLRPAWLGAVQDVLTEATLVLPDDDWQPSGGRNGLHTEGFGYLLAEMQHLHRSHPGAQW